MESGLSASEADDNLSVSDSFMTVVELASAVAGAGDLTLHFLFCGDRFGAAWAGTCGASDMELSASSWIEADKHELYGSTTTAFGAPERHVSKGGSSCIAPGSTALHLYWGKA